MANSQSPLAHAAVYANTQRDGKSKEDAVINTASGKKQSLWHG